MSQLKTYLKRTEKLLGWWDTRVPKEKVDLSVVSVNRNRGTTPRTLKGMNECGTVGCIAGWAFALSHSKAKRNQGAVDAMKERYGLHELEWQGEYDEGLFDMAMRPDWSDWREARRRLVSRIRQLKQAIKTQGRR